MTDDAIEELRKKVAAYAEGKDFRLNPDEEVVEMVLKGMLKKREKFGADYCPCRMVSGDKEKDAPNICPCAYHLEELERDGQCHCRLYIK